MKLVFLGTGGSHPTPQRNVAATALKFDGDVFLFDCGEGTQRQLMRSSISFMDIRKVFITHFHGDHFLGLPGMIQSMNLNEREGPLEVYGPRGTEQMVNQLTKMGYFYPGFSVKIREIKAGAQLRFDGCSVEAFQVAHNVPSLGYAFKEDDRNGRFDKQKALDLGVPEGPLFSRIQNGHAVEVEGEEIIPEQILGPPRRGRKVVFSGDTKPCDRVVEAALDAEVLVHEGTLEGSLSEEAVEKGHSSVQHAAEIARRARVGRLFINHLSPRYGNGHDLESEARDIFPGSVVPSDLSEHEIEL